MSGFREAKLGAAIGKKGIGKTYQTLQMAMQYVLGRPGVPGRKYLIFDVNDEFSRVKSISINRIRDFSAQQAPEIRRVRIFREEDGEPMTLGEMQDTLARILVDYRGGGFLIEDPSRYLGDHVGVDIVGAIISQRHKDCDIMIHFQTIGKLAHPKIWGNINYVRLHKTVDTVERHRNKFGGDDEHLSIAQTLVNLRYESGDQRFFCYLDMDKLKIYGKFSRDQFVQAVEYYINTKFKRIIGPMLTFHDFSTGKRKYDVKTAAQIKIEELVEKYYGN